MDDAELKRRLWEGFAGLQTLLGGIGQATASSSIATG